MYILPFSSTILRVPIDRLLFCMSYFRGWLFHLLGNIYPNFFLKRWLINFVDSLLLFLYIQFSKLVLTLLIYWVFFFLNDQLLFVLDYLICSNFVLLHTLSLSVYLFVLVLNFFYLVTFSCIVLIIRRSSLSSDRKDHGLYKKWKKTLDFI